MLYDANTIANLMGVSNVTIYAKFKLKEVKPYIVKKQGKSYVDEYGFNLIKQSLKINSNTNIAEEETAATLEVPMYSEDLINLKGDLIEVLKAQVEFFKKEIEEKNKQLESKDNLLENMQVLLKQEKEKQNNTLMLEEHFKEVDLKLMDIREKMDQRKEEMEHQKKRGFLQRLFKR